MKIRYLTSMSGPAGVTNRGDIGDVSEAEAMRLIEVGFAELVRDEPEREKAVRKPAPEKAAKG
jgi:hypothetical protein